MFVDLTDEQRALRIKVRDYFTHLMTPELRNELRGSEGGDQFRKIVKQMGEDGWLAVGWPKEYGGQGYGPTEQLIFFEEANIAGAPLPFVTISTVGPALMSYGTDLQKEKFLGGIASGDIHLKLKKTILLSMATKCGLQVPMARTTFGWRHVPIQKKPVTKVSRF